MLLANSAARNRPVDRMQTLLDSAVVSEPSSQGRQMLQAKTQSQAHVQETRRVMDRVQPSAESVVAKCSSRYRAQILVPPMVSHMQMQGVEQNGLHGSRPSRNSKGRSEHTNVAIL